MKVRQLHTDVDVERLQNETQQLIELHLQDYHESQISLTSVDGDDDWTSGNGGCLDGSIYRTINQSIQNYYIAELINRYPGYYRWRILRMHPRSSYSIHRDGGWASDSHKNFRIHIPVITDTQSLMLFYPKNIFETDRCQLEAYRMKVGNTYITNTTGYHSAINHSNQTRIHIVGEKNL